MYKITEEVLEKRGGIVYIPHTMRFAGFPDFIIDAESVGRLVGMYLRCSGNHATVIGKYGQCALHRFLFNAEPHRPVMHINGNHYDNRLRNLQYKYPREEREHYTQK